jgi:glycosyltransferase involved in cell wall biosynthesis
VTVIGICMVKDEQDIIAETLRRMSRKVDHIIVMDNGSTDGTGPILTSLKKKLDLTVLFDPEIGYYQARKMTALARRAAEMGADWVVPFDADEWWYSPFGTIAEICHLHPEACILRAALYDHVATGQDSWARLPDAFNMDWRRREAAEMSKVACRTRPPARIYQGNHDADYGDIIEGQLIIRHFPYRSPDQFIKKVRNGAAAYAASDLPEWEGAHWRGYGKILEERGPDVLVEEVFCQWFYVEDPTTDPSLIYDPAP